MNSVKFRLGFKDLNMKFLWYYIQRGLHNDLFSTAPRIVFSELRHNFHNNFRKIYMSICGHFLPNRYGSPQKYLYGYNPYFPRNYMKLFLKIIKIEYNSKNSLFKIMWKISVNCSTPNPNSKLPVWGKHYNCQNFCYYSTLYYPSLPGMQFCEKKNHCRAIFWFWP